MMTRISRRDFATLAAARIGSKGYEGHGLHSV
jgi:hypothetical protein